MSSGRRTFLRTALGAALVPLTACKSEVTPGLDVDSLVIGSGFGGAVAALRLTQAGVRTLLLERGRRWPIQADGNTFSKFEDPDERCAWLTQNTNFPGAPTNPSPGH